jgi:uncharacterized membrane protein
MRLRAVSFALLALLLAVCATPAAAQGPEASVAPAAGAAMPATPMPAATVLPTDPSPSAATSVSAASPSPRASASTSEAPSGPVVRGVFFFSPTCPHCEKVIAEDLPDFFAQSGGEATVSVDESLDPGEVAFYFMSNGRLQLLAVNVAIDGGARMFTEDSERLGLDQAGVPRLDIGDGYFTGDVDIPERLPAIIEAGLAGEGIDWPPVPGLAAALAAFPEAGQVPDGERTADDAAVTLPAETLSMWERVTRDPVGNGVAIAVLIALLASLVLVPVLALRRRLPDLPAWPVPVLAILGLAVSAYLGMVETNEASAVCGPVGDCNAVQQSAYAELFGIPIGVLGIIGYALLLAGWIVARLVHGRMADLIFAGIAIGAFLGVCFSAYLTFLEPFVIGATCMWCITSALTMLALLWLLARPGWLAWCRLRGAPAPVETPRP